MVWTHPPKVKKKDGDGMTKKQLRQMAEALQEAHAMLGGERERAERGEAEAGGRGGDAGKAACGGEKRGGCG